MSTREKMRWVPLEANPDVWNSYIQSMGVPPGLYEFQDIWSLDPEMLPFVPRPVIGIILLFPDLDNPAPEAPLGEALTAPYPEDLFYTKQTIGNACGTVAILHTLGNNINNLAMADDAFMTRFHISTKDLSPPNKAIFMEQNDELCALHTAAAEQGQTPPPGAEDPVEPHYVAFVHHHGNLVELDGCKPGPVTHGQTTPDSLLEDTAVVAQKFIDRAAGSGNIQFNVIALVAAQ